MFSSQKSQQGFLLCEGKIEDPLSQMKQFFSNPHKKFLQRSHCQNAEDINKLKHKPCVKKKKPTSQQK